MFISKKDLDNLENKLRAEFDGKIVEWNKNLEETLKNWELKPRQKSKKVVE